METLGSRTKRLRVANKFSQQKLADMIGVSKTSVIYWEKDENIPKYESLNLLANSLGTTADYLLTGKENSEERKKDGIPIDQVRDLSGREKVLVPFYPHIAGSCGGGRLVEAYEKTSEYKEIGKDILNDYGVSPADVKAFPAEGNSMMPVIMPNAIVYVDIGKQRIVDGKIYAICHGGLFKFKQLYNLPKQGIRMVSTNFEEYPEEKLSREELIDQEFEVVGYAFYIEGRLP